MPSPQPLPRNPPVLLPQPPHHPPPGQMVQVRKGGFAGRMWEVVRPAAQKRIELIQQLAQGERRALARERLGPPLNGCERLGARPGVNLPVAPAGLPLDAEAQEVEAVIN